MSKDLSICFVIAVLSSGSSVRLNSKLSLEHEEKFNVKLASLKEPTPPLMEVTTHIASMGNAAQAPRVSGAPGNIAADNVTADTTGGRAANAAAFTTEVPGIGAVSADAEEIFSKSLGVLKGITKRLTKKKNRLLSAIKDAGAFQTEAPEGEPFAVDSAGELIPAQRFGVLDWISNRYGAMKQAVKNKLLWCGSLYTSDAIQAAKHWHFQMTGNKAGDGKWLRRANAGAFVRSKLTPATLEDVHLSQKPIIHRTYTRDAVVFEWRLAPGSKLLKWDELSGSRKISCEDLLSSHESLRKLIFQAKKGSEVLAKMQDIKEDGPRTE